MASVLFISAVLSIAAPPDASGEADPFRLALVESIHCFAKDGKLAHLEAILEKYPQLRDARRDKQLGKPTVGDDYTPLQTAAFHGRNDVVALLIKKGADVNVADGYGYTPLHLAANGDFLDIVKQLVKAGANADAKTRAIPGGVLPGAPANGSGRKQEPIPARTALQIAANRKHTAVVEFLKTVRTAERNNMAPA